MSKEQHVRELALAPERAKLVQLIGSRAPETLDRYADLRSRGNTKSAHELIMRLHFDIREHERNAGSRVRKMGVRTATKFTLALDRFVGDLLRARAGTNTTGRIYRPTGEGDLSEVLSQANRAEAAFQKAFAANPKSTLLARKLSRIQRAKGSYTEALMTLSVRPKTF